MIEIIQKNKENVLISIKNSITPHTSSEIRDLVLKLINENYNIFTFDLSQVVEIDASGFGIFINLKKKLNVMNGDLFIVNVNKSIQDDFKKTRLNILFDKRSD